MISIVLRRARAVVLGALSGTIFGEIRDETAALVTTDGVLAGNVAGGTTGGGSGLRGLALVNDGAATGVGVGGRSTATPTSVSVAPNAAPPNHGQTGCGDCRGAGCCILNGA
jgi:hypothetical protein